MKEVFLPTTPSLKCISLVTLSATEHPFYGSTDLTVSHCFDLFLRQDLIISAQDGVELGSPVPSLLNSGITGEATVSVGIPLIMGGRQTFIGL